MLWILLAFLVFALTYTQTSNDISFFLLFLYNRNYQTLSFPPRECSVYDQLWRWFDLFESFPDDSFAVTDHEIF